MSEENYPEDSKEELSPVTKYFLERDVSQSELKVETPKTENQEKVGGNNIPHNAPYSSDEDQVINEEEDLPDDELDSLAEGDQIINEEEEARPGYQDKMNNPFEKEISEVTSELIPSQEISTVETDIDKDDEVSEEELTDNKNKFELIRAIELTKNFGDNVALNDINFIAKTGSLGILGPNGCGKSTFLKLLLKLIKPSKGNIELNPEIKDIRVIPDYPILPNQLTIDEWMVMLEKFHGRLIPDVDVQDQLDLNGSWKLKDLSAGQYRKAALLPAFFGDPDLIILDEPTNFLDIVTRQYVLDLLAKQIRDRGARVIIASHRIDEIRLLAEQALILKEGSMVRALDLFRKPIRSYEVIVDPEEEFTELLKEQDISISYQIVNGRKLFEVPNYNEVWKILFTFTKDGGTVISLRSIDELDKNIEDLIK